MTEPDIVLYHCPGACSQVTVCALEMARLPYRLELINLITGQQLSSEYASVYTLGKVPYLVADGVGLAENIAILSFLADLRPAAGIFPSPTTPRTRADALSGISFCSGTLHPIVRGMANPQRIATGDTSGVRDMAMTLGKKAFAYADERLRRNGWWLGELSIVDVYLSWALTVATRAQFDPAPFPDLAQLPNRLKQSPAFVAMLEEETASKIKLGL